METILHQNGYSLQKDSDVWTKPGYQGIAYSDGDEVELRVAAIIDQANDLSVLSPELRSHCTDWPSLYHLAGTRANLLRPFQDILQGADVLEIGAGCGAISRYLGECGANLLAVEGSSRRAAIARSRTRDLKNVTVLSDRFEQFQVDRKFDIITLIGVFEYANLFTAAANPPLAMLERIFALLKFEGTLIIAIENQLGLKYFAGAPEDHVGIPMYGIEGRYRPDQPQTFGRAALTRLLNQAGFSSAEFMAPFPDYKLPVSIVTEKGFEAKNFDASVFAWQGVNRDPQLPPISSFSLELAWPIVFENRIGLDLANSFLICASPRCRTFAKEKVLAYHYSTDRRPEFCKETVFDRETSGKVYLKYNKLFSADGAKVNQPLIKFICPDSASYFWGKLLSLEFIQIVTRDDWNIGEVSHFISRYLDILKNIANRKGIEVDFSSPYAALPGSFFDVVPQNLIINKDESITLIDNEWELTKSIELGHLLFRMLLLALGSVTSFGNISSAEKMTRGQFVNSVLEASGLALNESDYERYLAMEEQITEQVTGRSAAEAVRWWPEQPLPTLNLNQAVAERDGQIAGLHQAVAERDGQIAGLHQAVAERDGQIASLNQSMADVRYELNQILMSKSWQLTKPLRFARRTLVSWPHVMIRRALSENSRVIWRTLPISFESKRRLKAVLFNEFPWVFRGSKAYKAWEGCQPPSNSSAVGRTFSSQSGEQVDRYVPLLDAEPLEHKPVKVICFYLPQFHPIPENNAWWGEGFTEWTNVQPAKPQFVGHYQPHVPGELGFYNLLDPAVQRRQVELAKLYGIEGFCFYFYWFGGKRLLEAPLENYLNDSSLDLPFCLCWANENWTRRWDGLDSEILMAQQHSAEDDLAFIKHVSRYMLDPRYIRIGGKPLLLVYRPSLLPATEETANRWRDWCRAHGIGEIYLAYTQSFETANPGNYAFDAAIEFPPNNSSPPNITDRVKPLSDDFGSTVYDWRVFVARSENYRQPDYTLFRSVCPSWDNTARLKNKGIVFLHNAPAFYQRWLENAIRDTQAHRSNPDERLVFVNAWNEWAEGAHLEPDARHGYAYLQATRNALEEGSAAGRRRILLITHDCHPHGAQFLALEITRRLVRNGFQVAIVALEGGKLQAEFARLGSLLVVSAAGEAALRDFLVNYRSLGCADALTSTVVSGSLLPELKKYGFRVVSLIHELPKVIRGMRQESNACNIANIADKVIFPAELVRDQYATIAPVADEKAIIRPQGLLRNNPYQGRNLEAHREVCRRHGLAFDTRIILNIGYLDQRKGADLFVEIAAHVCRQRKDTVFIWVGHAEPEFEHKVRAMIAELGLQQRILLVGFDPAPFVYYAAATVYALTSREDPFPNVVLESASVGVPVVGFEGTTGAAEFIAQQGGLLARHLNVVHFAEQLEKLLGQHEAAPAHLLPDLSLQRYVLDLLYHLNGMARVSVIVPNYNYGRLIERRLNSIRSQTYPVYEIIVLDDASTDDSVVRIGDYRLKNDCDIRLSVNKTNSGSVFRQWVKGVQLATGDLVWIAEADDMADPEFLSTLVPAFSEQGTVMAFSQSKQITENGEVMANDYLDYTDEISMCWREDHFGSGIDYIREFLSIKNIIPNVSAVLFERQALLKVLQELGDGLFAYRVAGDWLVYLHVLAQGHLYYNARALNSHSRHQQSITSALALEKHLAEVAQIQAIAQDISQPDENVLVQAEDYLARLCQQFGIENPK
jgi:glycosyltransferase involved in cell wall biosynthesis/2-polyprenyl-3-methyl-5-hydroxy-6-metoxy-1,4-benzoquinol methylase